jgi:O-antigen/teichoic acid export membrane protein
MSNIRRVLANAGWNLLGTVLPLLAAAAAMPYLAQRLGTERFGLLTLGWVLIGYFGLFDFGLGRALTKLVAERVGRPSAAELPALCATGTALAGAAGLVGGLLVAVLAWWAAGWVTGTPGGAATVANSALRDEALLGLLVIALGIPPTVGTAALRGILEGFQRFKLLTAIRTPAGVLLFAAPCASAWFTPRLDAALLAMVLTRWLLLLAHWWPCAATLKLSLGQVQRRWLQPLLRLGGWLTVSNIVGPVIVYVDRFVIGGLLSAAALAYYAAPFELVSRLLVLPVALSGALFPALAAAQGAGAGHGPGRKLRRQALGLTLAGVLPLALLGAVFARPLLQAWMGPEFALHGTLAMQILLLGFCFNAAAQMPFAALHGLGLARQTALLHLVELPLYLVLLLWLVRAHGIEGAAAAWALRGAFDWALLSLLLRRAEQRPAAWSPG